MSQQTQLGVIADNVANVNTTGFKRLMFDFQKIDGQTNGQHVADFATDLGVIIDYSAGPIENTDNPLDLAIIGDAFFSVDVNGQTQYTRNGHFLIGPNGSLVNGQGHQVLDDAGAPIVIPAGAEQVRVTKEGGIATEDGLIAVVGLTTFSDADKRQMIRAGNGGYIATAALTPQPASALVTVEPGKLETANVNSVEEIIKMQDLSRKYQSAYRSIKDMQDLEQRAIRSLSQMPS